MSADKFYDYKMVCKCKRCGLTVTVPSGGREIQRLGSCPSCDMVSWKEDTHEAIDTSEVSSDVRVVSEDVHRRLVATYGPNFETSWDPATLTLMIGGTKVTDPKVIAEDSHPSNTRSDPK